MAFDVPLPDSKQNPAPAASLNNSSNTIAATNPLPATNTGISVLDDPDAIESSTPMPQTAIPPTSTTANTPSNLTDQILNAPLPIFGGASLNDAGNAIKNKTDALSQYAARRFPNATANVMRVEQAAQTYVTSEVGSAIDYIQKIKSGGYEGECANHVRRAIEAAAGISFRAAFGQTHPDHARQYISYLTQHGVPKIDKTNWRPEDAKPGQVAVFDKCPGHPRGHIEICTGRDQNGRPVWFSDCKQPGGFLANPNMRGQHYEVFDSQAIIARMRQAPERQPVSLTNVSAKVRPHHHRGHPFKV